MRFYILDDALADMATLENPKTLRLLDTPVHVVTMGGTLSLIQRWMDEPRLHQLATTNPEFVMRATQDAAFRDALWRADLCVPDGNGLVWASRWYGERLPERVAGSDLVYHLARLCARHGWRLFLLGAAPGVAEAAASRLQQLNPALVIAGTHAGSPSLSDNDAIVQRINQSRADMLYVAYGAPAQDLWVNRNRTLLTTVRMAMGVGGALDFIAGNKQRAPMWVQRAGLEWLFRLAQEPWRWRRMLALPRFMVAAYRESRRSPRAPDE